MVLLSFLNPTRYLAGEGGDGKIALYVYHLKERAEVRAGDLAKIASLFRSRDSNKTSPVDPRLVELLDRIEDHFGVRQVEIISGYRSEIFNRELKETGHTVANESLHIKGMAADIHLDEITEEVLRDYAQSLGVGGVGFYPSLHMVHVDVGPVRTWGEQAPRKKWVGEKNDQVPLTITVSPDRTLFNELGRFKVESTDPATSACLEPGLDLEFFDRGEWKKVRTVSGKDFSKRFPDLPYGKYRLRAQVCSRPVFQYSNEFYFKRL